MTDFPPSVVEVTHVSLVMDISSYGLTCQPVW